MNKASSNRRCRTAGIAFGRKKLGPTACLGITAMVLICTSCANPSPPGKVAALSVLDVQSGLMDDTVPLRWGGTIAKVHNKSDVTVLEIVSRPLLRSGRPHHNDLTDGRFLAEINGFLDPEIVSPGRDISLVGMVRRIQPGKVGEAKYRYPVMSVFEHRVWKKPSEIDPNSGFPHYFNHDRIWRGWPDRRRSPLG